MKQFFFFFFEKKIQNGRLKKSSFFKIANSQKFFTKISQMGPWVSRIEWCEGHWCSSTYMAVRLSDKSSKTAKKCIFCTLKISFKMFFCLILWYPVWIYVNSKIYCDLHPIWNGARLPMTIDSSYLGWSNHDGVDWGIALDSNVVGSAK